MNSQEAGEGRHHVHAGERSEFRPGPVGAERVSRRDFISAAGACVGACVCVCVPPWTKGFSTTFTPQAGGHSSFHQSVANEATDDWRGYEPGTPGSRTCFQHIDSNGPPCCCFVVSMVFLMIDPKTFPHRRCAAALIARHRCSCELQMCENHLFKHLQLR